MKKISLFYLAAALGLPSFLFPVTATWLGGDWNLPGSWNPNTVPNGIDDTAVFANVTANGNLGLDIIVGHVSITGGGVATISDFAEFKHLIFQVSSGNATYTGNGIGGIQLFNDSATTLLSPLTISNPGPNTLWFGYFTGSEDLTITNGTFLMLPDAGDGAFTAYTGNLNLDSTGVLDLQFSGSSPVHFFCGGITGTGELRIETNFSPDVVVDSVNPSTFSGTLTSNGNNALQKQGSATFTMNCSARTPGGTFVLRILEGAVAASSLLNLANPQTIFLSSSGTLHITGSTPFTYPSQMIFGGGTPVIEVDSTTALTLSGTFIDGGGTTLQKAGGGSLIFSGASVITTPTTVLAGTLAVTGSVALPVTVSAGTYDVSGSTSGTTTVNGGTFNITGTTSAATTVNSGGLLKGTGTLQNVTVNAGGIIQPGSSIGSIGTLNASGTLSLNGTTQIEISPSANSQIHVTGLTTLLGGTVNVIQDAGSYPNSGSYPIIVSDGGIVGILNPTVTGGLLGFAFSLDYSTLNTVTLVYRFVGTPIPTTGLTGQADRFARYLNQNVPTSSATRALFDVPADQLKAALNSACPSRNAFAPFAVQNTMISFSDLVSGHLVDQRFYHAQKKYNPNVAALMDDAASFTADSSGRMVFSRGCESESVWIGVMGEYAHQAALDQNPAFNFWSGGSMIGWDFYGDKNLFGFGGGAAYTHLIQDENGGLAKINYYFASLYDTFYGPCDFPLYIELALWGVYNQIHNYRNLSFPGFQGTASATFHSWELVPHFGIGYHASYCCFSLEPFAQFDLVVDWQEGFKEHGVGVFDMTHVSRNSQFLRSEGGLRLYKIKQAYWGTWMAVIKGSLVNKKTFGTGSVGAAIVGTNVLFNVETFRDTQNLGAGGFEMLWRWGQRKPVTLSLAYNGELGSQFWSQEAMVRLMKDF